MAKDSHYDQVNFNLAEKEHCYGGNVHLLDNPFLQTILSKISSPEVAQPEINRLVAFCYQQLLRDAVNFLLPTSIEKTETRMKEFTEHGVFEGAVVSNLNKAVVVDLARAGTWPSHICFDELNFLLNPTHIRQDHFYINRAVNEEGKVIGVDVSGSKIGGDQDNAFVFFPDPMGATGGSISHCVSHYKNEVQGKAAKYIALHLIVTPEYIKRMKTDHADVQIFALRLDRGLSSEKALSSTPGKYWEEERGLTDNQYIVPGAGGVGEVLNNSFV